MSTGSLKKLSHNDYTVGWVCALPIELAASMGMLDEIHQSLDQVQGDENTYALGQIAGHNVVIACLPLGNMGVAPAATTSANLLRSFPRVRFGLMVGIGGGAPAPRARPTEDIRLGDVVISTPRGELGGVIKYDHGKVVGGGAFEHTGLLNMPPVILMNAVNKLRGAHELRRNAISRFVSSMIEKVMASEDANPDFEELYQRPNMECDQLFVADYEHQISNDDINPEEESSDEDEEVPRPCRHCDTAHLVKRKPRKSSDPIIHYGTIASADQVMRHGKTREAVRKKYGVLCFEMEAAGLMNNFPCLVIRGICDYSDTHKHKIWQRYAAATAAAYAKELLGVVSKEDVEKTEEATTVMKKKQQLQARHRVLSWLGDDSHTKKFADYFEKWQPSTLAKLFSSEQYTHWIERDTHLLWCHGIPGGGKTVFSTAVMDSLISAQKQKVSGDRDGVVCLFCEYDRRTDQTVRSLACAMLRQLGEQCDQLPSAIIDLYNEHGIEEKIPKLEEIFLALTNTLRNFPRVFLVIDALDECSETVWKDLVSKLSDQQRNATLKLLITSRSTIEFRKFFGSCAELEIRADPLDVKIVVETLIDRSTSLLRRDPEFRREVVDKLAIAVDGIFLLVQPFLDSIIGERSRGYIEDALNALMSSPNKITTVYEEALNRIGGHRVGDRKLARRILTWVVESRRPLTRNELLHGLAITTGTPIFRPQYIIDHLEAAVSLCAGLVVINQTSDTVQLMHYTARAFFEDKAYRPEWMISASGDVAGACLTYLCYPEFEHGPSRHDEELEARLSKFPLFRYAAQYWGTHAREDSSLSAEIDDLAYEFLREASRVSSANQVLNLVPGRRGYSQDYVRNMSGLHVAAHFGLDRLVVRLLEGGSEANSKDSRGWTALHQASENGHHLTVLALLLQGAHADEKEALHGQTPLHLAALNGYRLVVSTLLDHNADVTVLDRDGRMAIHVAAWTGSLEVVRALLVRNDVDARSKDKLTPLHCAAAQGQLMVSQLLIRMEADVDALDEDGWTPLHWASNKRHNLENPRALSLGHETHKMIQEMIALHEKIEKIVQEQAQALQERFTAVKRALDFWQSRLTWLPEGFEVTVGQDNAELLRTLQYTSNVQNTLLAWPGIRLRKSESSVPEPPAPTQFVFAIQDEMTAMRCSFECSHERVARLLLNSGAQADQTCRANIDTKIVTIGAKPAALHLAAFSGHEAMVRLLLEKGVDVDAEADVSEMNKNDRGNVFVQWTALQYAVASRSDLTVDLLLQYGSSVNKLSPIYLEEATINVSALHLASLFGAKKILEQLISNGAGVNAIIELDTSLNTTGLLPKPKTDAPDGGALPRFDTILQGQISAIHLAALNGVADIVQDLIANGADVQTSFRLRVGAAIWQLNAMHLAVLGQRLDTVKLLVDKGADVHERLEFKNDNNHSFEIMPIHLAVMTNASSIVQELIKAGADINAICKMNVDSLQPFRGIRKKFTDFTAKMKPVHRDDLSLPNKILHRAARKCAPFLHEITEVPFLGKVIKPVKPRKKESLTLGINLMTPLHMALLRRNDQMVNLCLDAGADVGLSLIANVNKISVMATPLHLAAMWSRLDTLQRLFDVVGDSDVRPQWRLGDFLKIEPTVLQLAVVSNNEEAAHFFLDKGANPDELCKFNDDERNNVSAIHLAAFWDRGNMVGVLKERGAITLQNFRLTLDSDFHLEMNLLHIAACSGNEALVRLFMDWAIDPMATATLASLDLRISFGMEHLAIILGHQEVLQLLMQKNSGLDNVLRVDVEPDVRIQLTPLQLAILSGNHESFTKLMDSGTNARQKASFSSELIQSDLTSLQIATIMHQEHTVSVLVHELDAQESIVIALDDNQIEFTLLHLAVLWSLDMTELFLRHGLDPNTNIRIEGDDKHVALSALHLAIALGRDDIVTLLLKHGAHAHDRFQIITEDFNLDLGVLHLSALQASGAITEILLTHAMNGLRRSSVEDLSIHAFSEEGSLLGAKAHKHAEKTAKEDEARNAGSKAEAQNDTINLSTELLLNHEATRIQVAAIHIAMATASSPTIDLLLQDRSNANAICKLVSKSVHLEFGALHLAVLLSSDGLVKDLIAAGANLSQCLTLRTEHNLLDLQPIHLAVLFKLPGVAALLLEGNTTFSSPCVAKANQRTRNCIPFLYLASLLEVEHVTNCLSNGIQLHTIYLAEVEFLLHAEATALDIAKILQHDPLVTLLSEHLGARDDASDGKTDDTGENSASFLMLLLCFAPGIFSSVDLFNMANNDFGKKCKVNLQVQIDAKPNGSDQRDEDRMKLNINVELNLAPLHAGTFFKSASMISYILEEDVEVDAMCEIKIDAGIRFQFTALHLATLLDKKEIFDNLIEQQADPCAIGCISIAKKCQSQLLVPYMAMFLPREICRRLLKSDNEVEINMEAHLTTIHFAALTDNDAAAESLLEQGVNVDVYSLLVINAKTSSHGEIKCQLSLTALHMAAWAGNEKAAAKLLRAGASIDILVLAQGTISLDKKGRISHEFKIGGTALHIAAACGFVGVVQLLIDNGANVDEKSKDGRTPLQWAKDRGHEAVVNLIRKYHNRSAGMQERERTRRRWESMMSKANSKSSSTGEEASISQGGQPSGARGKPTQGRKREPRGIFHDVLKLFSGK